MSIFHTRYFVAVFLLFSALFILGSHVCAEENTEQSAVALQVQELTKQLHELRRARLNERQSYEQELTALEERIASFNQAIVEVSPAIDALKTDIAKRRVEKTHMEKRLADSIRIIDAVKAEAKPILQRMRIRVSAGIPFEKQIRSSTLQMILTGLENSSSQYTSDPLAGFWEFIESEIQLGKTVEVFNAPVSLNNGQVQKHSWQIRLGLANHFFIAEERTHFGAFDPSSQSQWEIIDENESKTILSILEILQGRMYPELVPVPFNRQGVGRSK